MAENLAVEMRDIYKYFGGFCALNGVSLQVEKGSIHALLGENGAGKSTLMNVLYGILQPESGEIYLNGEKCEIHNPKIAIKHGVGMVHQHFMLVEKFTVMENIILGDEITGPLGFINYKKAEETILEFSHKNAFDIDPTAKINDISVGMQQRVEILKALYRGAETLILDEPTAVLTPQETLELVRIMRNLVQDGKTVIMITHKLQEIKNSADVCTIIRRGNYIDTVRVGDVSVKELASKMVGREIVFKVEKEPAEPAAAVMEVKNLNVSDDRGIPRVKDLSLSVNAGEILGIAGIDGNGQKEFVEALTNLRKTDSGDVLINDVSIVNTTPKNSLEQGLSTIHEDRQRYGFVGDFTVAMNLALEAFNREPFSQKGLLNEKEINQNAETLIKQYDIRPETAAQQPMKSLSGGNKQKVIIAREVENDPYVLLAVQPTRGLDVGAIEYVHKQLVKQRDNGKVVVLVSYDLDEIMSVADRIAVIYDGKIVADLPASDADEEHIGLLMAGGGAE